MNKSKSILSIINRTALLIAVCLITLTSAFASTGENHVSTFNNAGNNSLEPSVAFKDLWIDYDVTEGGRNGMRIHVKFSVYDMKNLDSYLAIYFMNSNSEKLRDNNGRFNSSDGDVAVYYALKPAYVTTDYNDLSVFMPYSELDLSDGNWDLKMDVDVIYKTGGLIGHLTFKDFNYKQGDDRKSNVSASVKRIWVDYNVTVGGQKGMRVHVNFEVVGLKGVDCLLTGRVMKENGDFLTSNTAFSNGEGQLQIYFSMKPGFPTTVYEDASMFLPYSEITVRKGVWNLKFDFDVNYANGELIEHLGFHEFEFTK